MFSNIEENLERSIYHRIRMKAVEYGYALDIRNYQLDTEGNLLDEAEQQKYDTDLKALEVAKGFAVEIFGYSNNQNIGKKKSASIVIDVESFLPGLTGLDTTARYESTGDGKFAKFTGPSLTSDLFFGIKLICNKVKQLRVIHQIMVNALPRMGYIPWYYNNGLLADKNIMLKYDSMADVSWLDEGIIEKVYRYEILDAHETLDDIISGDISAIKEINVEINDNDNLNIK